MKNRCRYVYIFIYTLYHPSDWMRIWDLNLMMRKGWVKRLKRILITVSYLYIFKYVQIYIYRYTYIYVYIFQIRCGYAFSIQWWGRVGWSGSNEWWKKNTESERKKKNSEVNFYFFIKFPFFRTLPYMHIRMYIYIYIYIYNVFT
jgi:hypothetical protein